jgi:hypothetical protein
MRVWLVFRGAEWSLAAILTSDEINSLEQTVGTQLVGSVSILYSTCNSRCILGYKLVTSVPSFPTVPICDSPF